MNATHFTGPAANPVPARSPKVKFDIPARVAERAATRYIEVASGCWISSYSVASHGYAQIGWAEPGYRQVVVAHRAAWVYAHGTQIPEGMTIDHLCARRTCVNPNHLRLLTNFENARRTNGRDWPIGECANGHPNSMLKLTDGGKRWRCAECQRQYRRKYEAKVAAKKRNAASTRPPNRKDKNSRPKSRPVRKSAPKVKVLKPRTKPTSIVTPKPRAERSLATHCKRGHEFTESNIYRTPKGERWCRECMRIRESRRVRRKRITAPDGTWRWETVSEAKARMGEA